MSGPGDWTVWIIKTAPRPLAANPEQAPIDVTDRLTRDGLGSINRAVERDLLSFRTGDVTVQFDDGDGFMEDLLAELAVDERWTLAIHRRGLLMFQGVVLGPGSIEIDRKLRNATITAFGPTRILTDSSAEVVARTLGPFEVTGATAGNAFIDIDTTAGLLTDDVLHVTDQLNKEDITVKEVETATRCSLRGTLSDSYAAGSPVTVDKPFHRFKSIEFLVDALFTAAGVPIAEFKIDKSRFVKPAPTTVNRGGISVANRNRGGFAERLNRAYATVRAQGTYFQEEPDDDWTKEDSTDRAWVDWSRYFKEGEVGPSVILRNPVTGDDLDPTTGRGFQLHKSGFDYKPSTKTCYLIQITDPGKGLKKFTTTDGLAWTGPTAVAALPGAAFFSGVPYSAEYDQTRDKVFCSYGNNSGAAITQLFDVPGVTFADLKQPDDGAGNGYWGPVFIPSKDYILCLRASILTTNNTRALGSTFEICAFRGTERLFKRPFPNCLIVTPISGDFTPPVMPTMTMREVSGVLMCLVVSDGAVQIVWSDDEFQSFTMRKLFDNTTFRLFFGSRVKGQYRIWSQDGAGNEGYLTAAPFFAGVVEFADFEGLSVGEALQQMAVVSNAVFWIDDDLQGHYVARDLIPSGEVLDITDRVIEREEMPAWDETVQRVEVRGGGFEASSGSAAFGQEVLDITSPHVTNEALAQALAEDYQDFFSQKRALIESDLIDDDGHIFYPMDRVLLDGLRYMVYSSDHDPTNDQVRVELLEDRENP